jgi:hypothetical protein
MNNKDFSLKPLPSADLPPHLKHLEIRGRIARRSNLLSINYALLGLSSEIVVPVPADNPVRKNALWEETCFEFFLASKYSDRYWEFNLSPSGHWNVFSFKSYRQDMREETAFESLVPDILRYDKSFRLTLELDLDRIIPPETILQVAVSAVIRSVNRGTTYWALTHTGQHADFHSRDSFTIELAP